VTTIGPFETERDVFNHPAAKAARGAFDQGPGPGKARCPNRDMLMGAVTAAGVELGTYDQRILDWLAGYEPQMCAVISGLITRAASAGMNRALPRVRVPASTNEKRAPLMRCPHRCWLTCATPRASGASLAEVLNSP
jgi:hypothetical protein